MQKENNEDNYKLSPKVQIGHIHLTVSNMSKSLSFYRDILGFEVMQHMGGVAFLSAGGYHHHIAINIWSSENSGKPQEGHIGLYRYAILYPSRVELAKAVKKIIESKYPITGGADHGVSEAVYLKDPDGNGIELYYDKDKLEWPKDKDGKLKMYTKPLDFDKLLTEADL